MHFQIDRNQLDDKVTVLFLLKQRLQMICSNKCCPKVLQIVGETRSRLWISDVQNSFGLDLALCASDVQVIGCSKALLVAFYFCHNPSTATIQLSHSLIGMKACACSTCVFLVLVCIWFTQSTEDLVSCTLCSLLTFVDQIPFHRQFYLQLP